MVATGSYLVNPRSWHQLTDQRIRTELATSHAEMRVRAIAASKVTDPATLARIARTDREVVVRRTVVECLTDEALLAEIARQDPSPSLRYEAEKRLRHLV